MGHHAMNLGIKYLMTTNTTRKTKKLNVGQNGSFLYFSPVPPGIDIYPGVRPGVRPPTPPPPGFSSSALRSDSFQILHTRRYKLVVT